MAKRGKSNSTKMHGIRVPTNRAITVEEARKIAAKMIQRGVKPDQSYLQREREKSNMF